MQSLKYVPGSNGSLNASVATVSVLRSAGAVSNTVNTVSGFSTFFYGTMGTPHTFTDPQTGETITIISDATAVDAAFTINAGKIDIVAIAPGQTDLGSKVGDIIIQRPTTEWANNLFNALSAAHNDDGTLKNTSLDAFYKPSDTLLNNFVVSGGKVAIVSGLTGSFSNIVFYYNGLRYAASSIANKVYTINKDTYVDISTTGVVTYVEVANGATSGMALTANSVRVAKVVTNGSAITSISRTAQDPLFNPIYPQNIATKPVTHLRYTSNAYSNPPINLVIPYANRVYDAKNEWDTVNCKLTVTEPGLYQMAARIWWGSAGAGSTESAEIGIRRNSSTVISSDRPNGSNDATRLLRPFAFGALYLEEGDVIDVINLSTNGVRDIVSGYQSFVEIQRIG